MTSTTDTINAITSNATATVTVALGSETTEHAVTLSKFQNGSVVATVDGEQGTAKSATPAIFKALSKIYTVGFGKANVTNEVVSAFEQVKRNAPSNDLTEDQAVGMKEYTDAANAGFAELLLSGKKSKDATRAIGTAINAAYAWLTADVRAKNDSETLVPSKAHWGRYRSQITHFAENSKGGVNECAELMKVGAMSSALFAFVPITRAGSKSINEWVNRLTKEIASECAELLARDSETLETAKGFDTVYKHLVSLAKRGKKSDDDDFKARATLAGDYAAEFAGINNSDVDNINEAIQKTKLAKAIKAALAVEAETEEEKTEKAAKATVTRAIGVFSEMSVEDAAGHLATIMASHGDPEAVYAALGEALQVAIDATIEAQDAADAVEEAKDAE